MIFLYASTISWAKVDLGGMSLKMKCFFSEVLEKLSFSIAVSPLWYIQLLSSSFVN
jgi:hypothetical protein